jgi:integrating conjugative element membrane protein (TIGR03747 family)
MYINNKVISDELNGYSESIFNHFNNEKLNGRFDLNKNLIEEKALMAAGKASSYLDEMVGIKGSSKIHTILNKTRVFWVKIISIFTLTLKVAFVKILMMLSSIPLFAILGFVGLVDGLSQREIRRAELGRESSYLFHMLRKWVFRGIILLVLLWIAAPFSIQPQVIFLPMSVLFAFMISLTAQRFKKYL